MNTMDLGLAALVEDSGGGSALAAVGAALFGAATLGVAQLYWVDAEGRRHFDRTFTSVPKAIEYIEKTSFPHPGAGGKAPFIVDDLTKARWALVDDPTDAVRGLERLVDDWRAAKTPRKAQWELVEGEWRHADTR